MNTTDLDDFLIEQIDKVNPFTVSKEFIEYRNEMKNSFRSNKRTDFKRLMDADCLALEYLLVNSKAVEPPTNKLHDFCLHDLLVDVKCIVNNYYNISEEASSKLPWMLDGIKKGYLTHFSFIRMDRPHRPLEIGDIVTFSYIKSFEAKDVLNGLKPSKYNGYYFEVSNERVN